MNKASSYTMFGISGKKTSLAPLWVATITVALTDSDL